MPKAKTVTIVLTPLLAETMQRMIAEEQYKQKVWSFDDHSPTRKTIIEELGNVSDALAKEGYPKYFRM